MNIELYINNKLCDLGKSDLSIRLKRQFFKPTELNYKDSQKSYTISLPSTPTNDAIFRYVNVEETEGKFMAELASQLYVDGILIMDGQFRLSQITRDSYQGNLGVPTPLTTKDVFGEMKMNEIGDWKIKNWKRIDSIKAMNKAIQPPVFFPLVLYKLLNRNKPGVEQKRDRIDSDVNLHYNDIPASVNCVEMLKKIFANAGYNLSGSALDDKRLKALYVSYKNPNDYIMDWDVRTPIHLKGDWNVHEHGASDLEPNRVISDNKALCIYDIMGGENHSLRDDETIDPFGWIETRKDGSTEIHIPQSGYYKLTFNLAFNMSQNGISYVEGYRIMPGSNYDYGHSSEICLVKKGKRELKDYNLLFDGQKAQGVYNSQAYFFEDDTVIAAFSMGKTEDARNQGFKYRQYVYTPMVVEGSAVDSAGYPNNSNRKHKIDFVGHSPQTIMRLSRSGTTYCDGVINQIVWLEKGDRLGMVDVSTLHKESDLYRHNITYTIDLQPFRIDKGWLQLDSKTNSSIEGKPINWYDQDNYYTNELNVTQFLPSESSVNDWISNFCKAFNLQLSHLGGKNFSLDLKQVSTNMRTSKLIDLDQKTDVARAQNESLNLPRQYEIGFTVNNKEQGYYLKSEKDADDKLVSNTGYDGGGLFETNSLNTNVLKQNSNFSYCWYMDIEELDEKNQPIRQHAVPVITEHEVWDEYKGQYKDHMKKVFYNLPQRFWFKKGTETVRAKLMNNWVDLALVCNSYEDDQALELNYEDKPNSVMHNYFMLLTNQKNYTVVECYLTPDEYNNLNSAYVRFNGDLYTVAEADGYDPMGKSKTKLKLIKKM